MKLYKSVYDFPYAASVEENDGVIMMSFKDADGNNIGVDFDSDTLFSKFFVGPKEISDCSNFYLNIDSSAGKLVLLNKYAETFATKNNGYVYGRQTGDYSLAQIYIPYANSGIEEWAVRVNSNADFDATGNLDVDPHIYGRGLDEFEFIVGKSLPALRVSSKQSNADGTVSITVQLTKDGNDVQRSGVRVIAKSDSGYIAIRDQETDANGQVVFSARRLDLSASDQMVAEFGFKYKTNVVNCEV